ncbi:eukaryotic translation initiation factor 5B [Nilaparvata lugens]|uniref:eukaryotic translation initiation factor 5B n=1 Tax=Nilaparvata lugens TaxID=108931 RepID=UPI00193DF502|nr:eukaryotic translation initiation factor 5B [Nilaparvata lugens]
MGKAKKSKKLGREDDLEDDIDIKSEDGEKNIKPNEKKSSKSKSKPKDDEDVIDSDAENEMDDSKKKSKKSLKKKSVEDDDDVDEITNEISELSTNDRKKKNKGKKSVADNSDSEEEAVKKPAAKGKAKKSAGFALLAVSDDDDDDDDETAVAPDPPSEDEAAAAEAEKKKEKGGKKGKKGKKKKDEDDEEDLDKMLAELQMEYAGVKEPSVEKTAADEEPAAAQVDEPTKSKKKKKKGKEENEKVSEEKGEDDDGDETAGGTVKTAAQKKKEKKEREKQKKMAAKKQDVEKKPQDQNEPETNEPDALKEGDNAQEEDGDDDDKKKKKKKSKKEEEKDKKEKKGPGKKTIAAMQDALKKLREEEERAKKEEEEKLRLEEEMEMKRLEQARLEQEKKEKKKQKEKERKERLKAEGKLLSAKQKADRARAQAMIEALRAKGLDVPTPGEKKPPRPGTRIRPKKNKNEQASDTVEETKDEEVQEQTVQVEIVDKKEVLKVEEDVKDSWDAESSEDEEKSEETEKPDGDKKKEAEDDEEEESSSEEGEGETSSEEEDEDDESEEESSEDSDDGEKKTDAERRREKAIARIQKRREDAEKNKSLNELRAAVVCVLGHVDTGKTKILDKLRRTNVQDGEAGGITQQIGATNVPLEAIKEQTKIVKGFSEMELKIPGLLIIDTPGHESFSNLRSRGSSLCDIAILVVDIMHGLEPQTIESITLLKNKKTPFIVALNKIDRLYDWSSMARKDVRDVIKSQPSNTQLEFEQRTKEVIIQFNEQGLNAALFYENPDQRSYVSLVPTSAITGEGMGNLLALIMESCQTMLAKRLMFSEELQATVLEVKAIPGLGTTIDAILVNGKLREGDTMIVAGTDGPIVTQIRSLLMPQPMKELRVKNAYQEYKEIQAAQGVKIAAKDLEKAIAGLNLLVAQKPDEVEVMKEEVAKELKSALSCIKLAERGVYVQASTLGSLEALLEFLRTSKIPYSNIRIGPVVKKDVMKASTMLEHDSQYATILAFDVKIERDAQELADSVGVKIFQADIIYHLFDKFMAYREQLKQKKRDEFKHVAVFPCKLRVLPQFVFNSRDPIVMGVIVEAGIVKEGTPICVPSKEFVELGIVTSIENNHKPVESARKGQEVCIKIDPIAGESPKMFGRHFDEKDMLISKISRQSIDACKDYFRDDLIKADWQLMVELKKLFEIL